MWENTALCPGTKSPYPLCRDRPAAARRCAFLDQITINVHLKLIAIILTPLINCHYWMIQGNKSNSERDMIFSY